MTNEELVKALCINAGLDQTHVESIQISPRFISYQYCLVNDEGKFYVDPKGLVAKDVKTVAMDL